ncbi:MAG: leucine-rich repeat domain-containing protein [Bacteroidales bacterium]|nr:leucine-rich repeat domain-containing protein [Bacteroidales bacterium]
MKNLTELYLSINQITDISPLKELKNLTELYLSDNQLTDTGPLKELNNLTDLALYNNPLTKKQVNSLKRTLPGTTIVFKSNS